MGLVGCNPECRVCRYRDLDYKLQLEQKQAWADRHLSRFSQVDSIRPVPPGQEVGYRKKAWLRVHFDESANQISFGYARSVFRSKWEKEWISWNTCPIHSLSIRTLIQHLQDQVVLKDVFGIWVGEPEVVLVAPPHRSIEEFSQIDWNRCLPQEYQRVWFHPTHQVGKTVFQHSTFYPVFDRLDTSLRRSAESTEERLPRIRSFRQVALEGANQARTLAVQHLLENTPEAILDLYCGVGELAEQIPGPTKWIGVEANGEAVKIAQSSLPSGRCRVFQGLTQDRLRDRELIEGLSLKWNLYLNPPRPGVDPETWVELRALMAQGKPERVAYLSCSASSLARDLETFSDCGYRVTRLQPFDFFPQTEHFEVLALLTSKESS